MKRPVFGQEAGGARGGTRRAGARPALLVDSFAQTQSADDGLIPGAILHLQVAEQAGSLADHLEESAPAGVVLLVSAHVLVELVDASGEQGDLHFGGAG